MVAPGAKLVEVSNKFKFTEGPAVDAKGNIYFSDIPNNRIHKWSVDGKVSLFQGGYRDFLDRVGWSAEAEDGPKRGKAATAPKSKETRRMRAQIVTARSKATNPLKNRVSKLEKEIVQLEEEVQEHDQQIVWAASDGRTVDLAKHGAQAASKRRTIDERFEQLEKVSEELDKARATFDAQLEALG